MEEWFENAPDEMRFDSVKNLAVVDNGVIFEVDGKAIGFLLTRSQMFALKKGVGLRLSVDRARKFADD